MATIGYNAAVADAFGIKVTGRLAYLMWGSSTCSTNRELDAERRLSAAILPPRPNEPG